MAVGDRGRLAWAFVGLGGMVKSPTPADVVAWVKRTTKAQGVPVKVIDAEAVEGVVSLLQDGRKPKLVRGAKSG